MEQQESKPNDIVIKAKQEVSVSKADEVPQAAEPPATDDEKAVRDGNTHGPGNQQPQTHQTPDYCVLPEWEKIALMLTASFAAIISPISSSIYLPAVNVLSRDLNVSISLINVTISTYLVSIG